MMVARFETYDVFAYNSWAALKDSLTEEAAGKGRRFRTGREAIRWLDS